MSKKKCFYCDGTGKDVGLTCPMCKGEKTLEMVACTVCRGTKKDEDGCECLKCAGTGEMPAIQVRHEKYFDKVRNRNWKGPINKIVRLKPDEYEHLIEAVAHFTGSVADIEELGNGKVRVTADGYYACIGG